MATPTTSPATSGRLLRRSMDITAAAANVHNTVSPQLAAIRAAREAAEIVLGELLHRSDDLLDPQDMARLQPEIELARFTVNDARQKEIDLLAASTTLATPDPATVAKLQSLAESIDKATVRSAIASATIDGLAAILNSAIRISAMT